MQRWIIHIDMDAFFAAVEQRDRRELQGQPVIVGGVGTRGVVSTASYEARKFGVHSAMPMAEARRRCPQAVFLSPDHEKYSRVSAQLMNILSDFSPLVEPLSLDEAFLDVSGMEWLYPDPSDIAHEIQQRIQQELQLTASAGVAANKFLAKFASDLKKPGGLVCIRPGEEMKLLAHMPVGRLWGVGKVLSGVLHKAGITTIGRLAETDDAALEKICGNQAYELKRLATGLDDRPVVSNSQPQSVGKETTFSSDLTALEELNDELLLLCERVGWRLRRLGITGRTVTVKIRFASFKTITRSHTLPDPVCLDEEIYKIAKYLLHEVRLTEGVRLLGVTVSHLYYGSGQTMLFDEENQKRSAVSQALDQLKAKYGETIVSRGRPRYRE